VHFGGSQFENCNDINQLGVIPISKPDSRSTNKFHKTAKVCSVLLSNIVSQSVHHCFCLVVGYNLNDPGITLQFQAGTRDFYLSPRHLGQLWSLPSFLLSGYWSARGFCCGLEWLWHEADQASPLSAKVQNTWSSTSSCPCA
jgi:hypothetical protein